MFRSTLNHDFFQAVMRQEVIVVQSRTIHWEVERALKTVDHKNLLGHYKDDAAKQMSQQA